MKKNHEEVDQIEGSAEEEDGRLQFHGPSQLFLIRLWAGEASRGHGEWHGKVQHAVSGETYYFHSWPELTEALLRMMPGMGRANVRHDSAL